MAKMTVREIADYLWETKRIKVKEAIRLLQKAGLEMISHSGSHTKWGHPKVPRVISFSCNKLELDTGARKDLAEYLDDWGPLIECL